jgi:hypothetical protein
VKGSEWQQQRVPQNGIKMNSYVSVIGLVFPRPPWSQLLHPVLPYAVFEGFSLVLARQVCPAFVSLPH